MLDLRVLEGDVQGLDFDADDAAEDETVVASASLARVSREGSWLDSLDAASGSLQAVGGAFNDREWIIDVDRDAMFPTAWS